MDGTRTGLDRGIYLLVLRLRRDRRVLVGRLGHFEFPKGYYVYVGSAQRALEARLARHRRPCKPRRWHIDYLSAYAEVKEAWVWPLGREAECRLGRRLAESPACACPAPGFGSSDCRCTTHLYYLRRYRELCETLARLREEWPGAGRRRAAAEKRGRERSGSE